MAELPLIGIFVGGQGRRMGGIAKGLLPTPSGEPLVERLIRVVREAVSGAPLVLVGERTAYAEFGLPMLKDVPPGIGPLGGLSALLAHAEKRAEQVIALSCDLPYVSSRLLGRLASDPRPASILAPYDGTRWQPFFARYRVEPVRKQVAEALHAERRSLQYLFWSTEPRPEIFSVGPEEIRELTDWDEPADLLG